MLTYDQLSETKQFKIPLVDYVEAEPWVKSVYHHNFSRNVASPDNTSCSKAHQRWRKSRRPEAPPLYILFENVTKPPTQIRAISYIDVASTIIFRLHPSRERTTRESQTDFRSDRGCCDLCPGENVINTFTFGRILVCPFRVNLFRGGCRWRCMRDMTTLPVISGKMF